MTLKGAIDQLVELRDHALMPKFFRPYFDKVIETIISDAVSVKNGQWKCSDDMYETAICSCCGWDTTEPYEHIRLWFKFCPNCGARMGGEQDG